MTDRLFSRQALAAAAALLAGCLLLTMLFKVHEGGVRGALSQIGFCGLVLIVVAYAAAAITVGVRRARA